MTHDNDHQHQHQRQAHGSAQAGGGVEVCGGGADLVEVVGVDSVLVVQDLEEEGSVEVVWGEAWVWVGGWAVEVWEVGE